jgi:hypothetical protein
MRLPRACIRIALLAAYLLGGTWGLPIIDAAIYHSTDGRPVQPHVEAAGGCGHADGCTLAAPAPPATPAVEILPVTRTRAVAQAVRGVRTARLPTCSLLPSQHPRAPPVQLS